MESTATLQNFFVGVKDGKYVGQTETISAQAAPGHVLVKVAYSTCDPYDGICSELFKSNEGFRLGGEGSGVIISVGEGVDRELLGKKISFHAGAWAHYKSMDVATNHFIVLDDSQDLAKAAASYINPLTTIGQLEFLE